MTKKQDIDNHNKSIVVTKYFTIKDAIKAPIKNSRNVFIIANEIKTSDNSIGRYYTVFPSFKIFLKNRDKFNHCHELLIDHINNDSDPAGRLVFDFDIKFKDIDLENNELPDNFHDQIQDTILIVVERYFTDIDCNIIEFIWSTSQNPNKVSKHLTVKNIYFDNWIKMSRIFYRLFCIVWDKEYRWIRSTKLVDFQIVRNNGSLRMVGSTKIDGFPLVFDNDEHELADSLIRIYSSSQREAEQLVTKDNITNGVLTDVLNVDEDSVIKYQKGINISTKPGKIVKPKYAEKIYKLAFEMYDKIDPGVFKMGKISGDRISFIRNRPHKCLLSGKIHEQENAYCIISSDDEFYFINFGCYRNCYHEKTIQIGVITTGSMMVMIDPNFEFMNRDKKVKRTKKKPILMID